MKFKVALLFILISLSDLSHALYGSKAVGVNPSLNAVVSLHLSDAEKPEYDFFCSGVLVAPDKILTTGHCIEVMATEVYEQWNIFSYEPEKLKVKIAGVKYAVADVILAPSYFESVGLDAEDLALIKLKKPVTSVKPFKLAPINSLKAKQAASLVARGQIAETTILAVKKYAHTSVVFTDGSKAGVCAGDSGGALLVKSGSEYLLAGILSAQEEGCPKKSGISIFPKILK
jgi:secreted trypsin-like serine protease